MLLIHNKNRYTSAPSNQHLFDPSRFKDVNVIGNDYIRFSVFMFCSYFNLFLSSVCPVLYACDSRAFHLGLINIDILHCKATRASIIRTERFIFTGADGYLWITDRPSPPLLKAFSRLWHRPSTPSAGLTSNSATVGVKRELTKHNIW